MTGKLKELSESYHERVRFGGRTVDITANPVLNEAGGRLGTVVEWADVTDQLKVEAEIVEGEVLLRDLKPGNYRIIRSYRAVEPQDQPAGGRWS